MWREALDELELNDGAKVRKNWEIALSICKNKNYLLFTTDALRGDYQGITLSLVGYDQGTIDARHQSDRCRASI